MTHITTINVLWRKWEVVCTCGWSAEIVNQGTTDAADAIAELNQLADTHRENEVLFAGVGIIQSDRTQPGKN